MRRRGRAARSAARSPTAIRPPRSCWLRSTLGATLVWREGGTNSDIAAADFFLGPMVTALPLGACLAEVRFPVWPEPRVGVGLPRDQRAAERFRLRVGRGAGRARRRRPLHARGASASAPRPRCRCGSTRWPTTLQGQRFDEGDDARCGAALRSADIEPMADLHASARIPQARRRDARRSRHRRRLSRRREARMKVELDINGQKHTVEVEPRTSLLDCLRDKLLLTGAHAGCEHGVCGACTVLVDGARGALLPDVRRAGRRLRHHHHRGPVAGARRAVAHAGRVLRDPRHAVRLLHAGDDPRRPRAARRRTRSRRARRSSTRSPATSAAAPAMRRSSRRSRSPPSACAGQNVTADAAMSAPRQIPLRLVRPPRARGPPLRRRQGQLRRRHRAAGHQARRAGDVPASGGAHRLDRQVRGAGDARRALRARRRGACRRDRCRC